MRTLIQAIISKIRPRSPMSLSDFIKSRKLSGGNMSFLMRPDNDDQAMAMATTFIKSFKDNWSDGGYIFVDKSQAPGIVQQLTAQGIPYCLVRLPETHYIEEVVSFDNPPLVWVFVEDDTLSRDVRAVRLEVIQNAIRERLSRAFTEATTDDVVAKSSAPGKLIRLLFMGTGLPISKGFVTVISQMRAFGFCGCFVDSQSIHDRYISRLYDQDSPTDEALSLLNANTIRVFGSGSRHLEEYWQILRGCSGAVLSRDKPEIDFDRMRTPSKLGLAFGFGKPLEVDLTQ